MHRSRSAGAGAIAVVALAVVLLAGYASRASTPGPNLGGDVAQGLQSTLETLRDPWGFYVDPTYYDGAGSIYSTALLDTALGISGHEAADAGGVATRVCASSEKDVVGEPWFTWAMVTVLGKAGMACSALSEPPRTGDPTVDIPQYFAWAQAVLAGGGSTEAVATKVWPILSEQQGTDRSPYVMWRMDQLEDMLGLPSTAVSRPAAAPAALRGPDDLTELWGYTMRCQSHRDMCSSAETVSDRDVAVAAVSYPDDLSLAGALAVLRARSAIGHLEDLTRDVEARRVKEDGLIRGSRFAGTIDTTFIVLQLAPDLFPGGDPEIMSAELLRRVKLIPADDRVKRLRAIAILKAVDAPAWQAWHAEVDASFAKYDKSEVTKDSFREFVDTATAFGVMGIDAPTAHLKVFEVRDAETDYLARLASANAWALSNGDEVLREYLKVRQDALARAESPSEPVAAYVAGLRSLAGPGISVSPQQREAITQGLDEGLRGCVINGARTEYLFRFNTDSSSACSLTITAEVIKSSFGDFP